MAEVRTPVEPTSTVAATQATADAGRGLAPATTAAMGDRTAIQPTLAASPNPAPPGPQDLGTTTISWSTGGRGPGEVWVSDDGAPEKLFASGAEGSQEAAWIRPGATYEFRLYAGSDHTTQLASVKVICMP